MHLVTGTWLSVFCRCCCCYQWILFLFSIMMERADSSQKLYTRMRLWEFPDQYVVEPTDGSCGSSLAISRKDGSMNLIGRLILLAVLCPGFCSICCVLFSGVNCECFTWWAFLLSPSDELPDCNSVRVPKIWTIFGVVGMLKLLAGKTSCQTLKFCSFMFYDVEPWLTIVQYSLFSCLYKSYAPFQFMITYLNHGRL